MKKYLVLAIIIVTSMAVTVFVTISWTKRYINLTVYSDFAVLDNKVDLVYAASSLHCCNTESYITKDTVNILCLGNSLTLFPRNDSIGWHCNRGMAASKTENDYVHILERRLNHRKNIKKAVVVPLNIKAWEKDFSVNKDSLFGKQLSQTDIVVIRLGENIPDNEIKNLRSAITDLILYCERRTKKIIITGVYFPNMKKDAILKSVAIQSHHTFVPLSWISLQYEDHPSIGDTLFDDNDQPYTIKEEGVITHHPGDETMMMIANAIETAIK